MGHIAIKCQEEKKERRGQRDFNRDSREKGKKHRSSKSQSNDQWNKNDKGKDNWDSKK